MSKKYTAAEIAQMRLPDLPTTKKAILTRAERENWIFESRMGPGGIRKMFSIPPRYTLKSRPGSSPVGTASESGTTAAETSPFAGDAPHGNVVGTVVAGSAQGDMDRIQLVVRAVSEWEAESGMKINEERRPAVIAVLYDYVKKSEEAGEGGAGIERFLKALG